MYQIEAPISVPQNRKFDYFAIMLFSIISVATVIGVPLFGYLYGYTWLDWTLFGVLYAVTGLGITVGYHLLISHRSFTCSAPVKIVL